MKMSDIEVLLIQTPPPHSGGKLWYIVKIITDEGIYGLGESMPHHAFTDIERSYKKLAEDVFEKWFKGKDPFEREKIFKDAYNELCAGRTDLIGLSIISAFDTAMWDICGKAVNLPVYQMLGGKFREKLKSYSYISYAKPNQKIDKNSGNRALWYGALWGNADLLCERAIEMVEEGFLALKFDPLEYVQLQSEKHLGIKLYKPYHLSAEDYKVTKITMDALRDSVGDKCDIIIGTHGQMTTASAISYSKFLENYLPLWIEEPIPPENTKEMAKVRMSTSIPIAAGEHLSTIYEFLRVLEDGAASIIQPDIGNCGGITQAKKIAAIAESYYVDVAPHVWGGPVLTAATFQLSMCIPNFIIQESILRSKDFYSEITTDFIDWKNGYLYPSKKSGLGIELNEKYIKTCLLQ